MKTDGQSSRDPPTFLVRWGSMGFDGPMDEFWKENLHQSYHSLPKKSGQGPVNPWSGHIWSSETTGDGSTHSGTDKGQVIFGI